MDMRIHALLILIFLLLILSCARRGRPEGGPKDEDKPVMVKAEPDYGTVNFKAKEIKLYFDEFIKLKDISTQLVISPPLKYQPIIVPQGTASKYISIKILDTLQENTTYTFNFGKSVIDNTEGNVLENFKYVVSTGDYIDSLSVKGFIKDALLLKPDKNIVVMLYKYVENFNDSVVFKERPSYVGAMLDSVNYEITNIRDGKYVLLAMNDNNKNYKYNPKDDKIGFYNGVVETPTDLSYPLVLFPEDKPFKLPGKPSEVFKGQVYFGFEGNSDSLKINVLSEKNADFKSHYAKDIKTDTVKYWFNNFDKDSIQFQLTNKDFSDKFFIKLRKKEIDSLKLVSGTRGSLELRDTLKLSTNNPVFQIDTTKITLYKQDSVQVKYTMGTDPSKLNLLFYFTKEFDMDYSLNLKSGAYTDIYGIRNDSLVQKFNTKRPANYSSVFITLKNVKSYPLIVQLMNERGSIGATKHVLREEEIQFENIMPGRYKVRVIYDANNNKKWDSGNYLAKIQPEEVYYFKTVLTANANWEIVETFILE